jgi:inositol-phosphate phosphatase / L-galactose 1-phosphate phosphatase / histidinol-phosphatase
MRFAEHADVDRCTALAGQLADSARAIARRYFRRPITIETKADLSPVTAADREIEAEMRQQIHAEFPTHGIQGEEFGIESGTEFTWVLDPIDGTKSFVSGFPLFGSLIALAQHCAPVLGVIEAPGVCERWLGIAGGGTTFNGEPARTSSCDRLERARLYTTTAETFLHDDAERFHALGRRALMRRYGGDCYLYGMLASGHCDLVIETALKPHDFMALVPVVEGAGGKISDWQGQPLTMNSGDKVLAAATPMLWSQALEILRS